MRTLDDILNILGKNKDELRKRFNVDEIGVFGSFVRGEVEEGSDVDILVDFTEPISFFEFLDLEEYLEGLLELKVDLVSRGALKPHIGANILKEVSYI